MRSDAIRHMQEKGVTVTEVAKRLDKTKASNYYDGLGETFKELVDIIASESKKPKSDYVSRGSNVSGNVSYPALPAPTESVAVVKQDKFADLEGVLWAKEAILSLADNGVINGRSEGVFAPNENIKREEFVKIIVVAFDIIASVNITASL